MFACVCILPRGCCKKDNRRRAAMSKAIETQFRSLGKITYVSVAAKHHNSFAMQRTQNHY